MTNARAESIRTDLERTTVSPKKAASLLGRHEDTIRRYIRKGVIEVRQYTKGGWIDIPLSEIVKLDPSLREKIESGMY